MHDLLITGGTVYDGSGAEPIVADVAISNGRIDEIGELASQLSRERIDASGKTVAPGFIDVHCHSELALVAEPEAQSKLRQGVTTEILGNCGWSAYPHHGPGGRAIRELSSPIFGHPEVDWEWQDLNDYFDVLVRRGTSVNVATLVGHGNVRAAVMGLDNREPTASELEAMKAAVQLAMDHGALGISSGLAYPPGVYASTDELVALAEVSARNGGLYATHLRDQVDGLVDSVREALDVGRAAGSQVAISHHKSVGRRNYGVVQETLAMLDQASRDGLAVSSDIYPYLAGSSSMLMLLPPWVWADDLESVVRRLDDPSQRARMALDLDTGLPGWENRVKAVGWENVVVSHVGSLANRYLEGETVAAASAAAAKAPLAFVCDLLVEERCDVGDLTTNSCESDLRSVLTHDLTVVGSDGLDVGERPHPRQYGTFPRILGTYVRDEAVLTMATAIRKMSGQSADTFGLSGMGYLRPGYQADVTVFDSATVLDRATYDDPRQYPVGIDSVVVGGVVSIAGGESTGMHGGRIVRRSRK
ncbi:MAG: dihydroorotase [Marmoricola sp.]|nr:dihydroorotase [Marmoricola sp.]